MNSRWIKAGVVGAMLSLGGCSVWPVNQDPDGIAWRQNANHILFAVQSYHEKTGHYPNSLPELMPAYLGALPKVPNLRYDARDGSLTYHYIPSWPQLRWTWCQSHGDMTEWHCTEHLTQMGVSSPS